MAGKHFLIVHPNAEGVRRYEQIALALDAGCHSAASGAAARILLAREDLNFTGIITARRLSDEELGANLAWTAWLQGIPTIVTSDVSLSDVLPSGTKVLKDDDHLLPNAAAFFNPPVLAAGSNILFFSRPSSKLPIRPSGAAPSAKIVRPVFRPK